MKAGEILGDTRETDNRLRSWLDANQMQRERMCAQLLPLLSDYSSVEPRRPKGGPDGSRDLQAVYAGTLPVWGAVGFRNSPRDNKEDKKWVEGKFGDDLDAALAQKPDLQGFVFFTNVDLTPGELDALKELARGKGVGHAEIFARERIRLVLDSIEGWGYRLQFLEISMSKEEQLAFIKRYGSRLELLLEQQREELKVQRKEIDQKLRRIEFLHDCSKLCRGASFVILLKKAYTPDELGHFRILLQVMDLYEHDPHPTLWFGARDGYSTWHSGDQETLLFGVKTLVWSRNPDHEIQNTVVGALGHQGDRIEAWGHLYQKGPFHTLGSFDRKSVKVFVTEPLVDALNYVGFTVKNYLLIGVPREHIASSKELPGRRFDRDVEWLEELNDDERAVRWTELYIRGPDAHLPESPEIPPFMLQRALPWDINFENYTPVKARQATEEEGDSQHF